MKDIPAFPDIIRGQLVKNAQLSEGARETIYADSRGMTLRDYFAAKAMSFTFSRGVNNPEDPDDEAARAAYQVADAMLDAREEKSTQ